MRLSDPKEGGAAMKRKGKTLTVLPDGAPRRMSDGKNAWRKMNDQQRRDFLAWLPEEAPRRFIGKGTCSFCRVAEAMSGSLACERCNL